MERRIIESSNIKSVGYDQAKRILEVEFKNGGIYQYEGVHHMKWHNLMIAGSKGKYFHEAIKLDHKCKKVGQMTKERGGNNQWDMSASEGEF